MRFRAFCVCLMLCAAGGSIWSAAASLSSAPAEPSIMRLVLAVLLIAGGYWSQVAGALLDLRNERRALVEALRTIADRRAETPAEAALACAMSDVATVIEEMGQVQP